jgi:trimethylamine--corrinoid protein Co-methyltransferase
MTESGVTFDPAQFVLDNEYARLIKFAVRGVKVNDQTLLVDDIIAVGTHKDYLSLDSTLARMREPSTSQLLDRRVREDWEADGGHEVNVKARAKALEILEAHQPTPVDPEALAQVRAIVDRADRERGG